MRYMLLSFKAEVFERVLSGEKIYEHRKNFPDEPITAYLYVGKPIQAIVGIMHLNNRTSLEVWKEKYAYDINAVDRINEYLKYYRYVMEISDYQHTNMLSVSKVKEDNPEFNIPYMYYYLDGSHLLEYIQNNLVPQGNMIIHSFDKINSDQICKS